MLLGALPAPSGPDARLRPPRIRPRGQGLRRSVRGGDTRRGVSGRAGTLAAGRGGVERGAGQAAGDEVTPAAEGPPRAPAALADEHVGGEQAK